VPPTIGTAIPFTASSAESAVAEVTESATERSVTERRSIEESPFENTNGAASGR
jgi:hypothetical protein